MNAEEMLAVIKKHFEQADKEGLTSILTKNLVQYVDDLRAHLGSNTDLDAQAEVLMPSALERYKAELSLWREERIELFRASMITGQSALKYLMLINGGAAVAILAFIGNTSEHSRGFDFSEALPFALIWFAGGVLLAALCSVATYLSQFCYSLCGDSRGRSFITGVAFHILTFIFGLAALGAFAGGICTVFVKITAKA